MATATKKERTGWVRWLKSYGGGPFFDAFLRHAQDAEGECVHCGQKIYLDIVEGGGVPDWRTSDGDYGCGDSPETTEEGVGSHEPKKL